MKNYDKLYIEAKMVASLAHRGKTYDIFPYEKHLMDVEDNIKRFGYAGDFIIAAQLHDTIEDGDLTYNKIKKAFGENVAEMVLACTDPSDVRNRKEKKLRVYAKLNEYPDAIIIKLADRIANIEHSIRFKNNDKTKMYRDEHEDFTKALKRPNHATEMWDYLENIFVKKDLEMSK